MRIATKGVIGVVGQSIWQAKGFLGVFWFPSSVLFLLLATGLAALEIIQMVGENLGVKERLSFVLAEVGTLTLFIVGSAWLLTWFACTMVAWGSAALALRAEGSRPKARHVLRRVSPHRRHLTQVATSIFLGQLKRLLRGLALGGAGIVAAFLVGEVVGHWTSIDGELAAQWARRTALGWGAATAMLWLCGALGARLDTSTAPIFVTRDKLGPRAAIAAAKAWAVGRRGSLFASRAMLRLAVVAANVATLGLGLSSVFLAMRQESFRAGETLFYLSIGVSLFALCVWGVVSMIWVVAASALLPALLEEQFRFQD